MQTDPALSELTTPCALVDLDRLERNTRVMAERVTHLGSRLRPHIKTHKCIEAGRLQVRDHFGGITVSTLAEARAFAAAGFRDLTYAVPVAATKLPLIADIAARADRFTLLADHPQVIDDLQSFALAHHLRLAVLLKIDCGNHRCGVDPNSPESVRVASHIASCSQLEFRGILAHAGQAYGCHGLAQLRQVAEQERQVAVSFAGRLRGAGITVPEVSIGSTPTLSVAQSLEGITEVRPGNYVFYDVHQARIGSCSLDDVAFSVLVTVIGAYPDRGTVVIDAGALALSKDPGPTHVDPGGGYGVVADVAGRVIPGKLVSLSQEHGVIQLEAPGSIRVGSQLRVSPNHSCLAAAAFDTFHVMRAGRIIDEWKPARGW